MKNIDPIITRLMHHFDVKTRKELMEKWGYSKETLKTWVHKDRIPPKRIGELAEREGLTQDWVLNGTLPKYAIAPYPEPKVLTDEVIHALGRVAESQAPYGMHPLTKKLNKAFDALDDDKKEGVYAVLIEEIKKRL